MAIYGEKWDPDTRYSPGDYVYAPDRPGLYYVAQNMGTSHSKFAGTSGSVEPPWNLDTEVQDDRIFWIAVKAQGNEQSWRRRARYQVGQRVVPTTGPILWGDTYYAFRASRFVYKPEWPNEANVLFYDNNVLWKSQLSVSFFLPRSRLKESAFIELYKIIDYLSIQEEIIFKDVKHKFNDREELSIDALKTIISEFGYDYIAEALNLTEQELKHLVAYIGLVHVLKGSKTGLYLVMELMGISYRAEEWWEKTPKGEADTWSLYAEVDAGKATSNMVERLINFTRNYVYPVLETFEITYKIDFAVLDIYMGGFVDAEYEFVIDTGWMVLSIMGGFIDKELGGPVWLYRPNMKFGIIVGGFVDQEIIVDMRPSEHSIIAIESGDRAIVTVNPHYNNVRAQLQISLAPDFADDHLIVNTTKEYTELLAARIPVNIGAQQERVYARVRVEEKTQGWSPWSDVYTIYAGDSQKAFAFNLSDSLSDGFDASSFINLTN